MVALRCDQRESCVPCSVGLRRFTAWTLDMTHGDVKLGLGRSLHLQCLQALLQLIPLPVKMHGCKL
eukprot:6454754-Amphidinium_carterae.1